MIEEIFEIKIDVFRKEYTKIRVIKDVAK